VEQKHKKSFDLGILTDLEARKARDEFGSSVVFIVDAYFVRVGGKIFCS
jgi:hypothetical protein